MQLFAVLALLALARFVIPAAQPDGTAVAVHVQHAPRFVIVDDYIRDFIAADWDAHANDAIPLERAYCLRWQLDEFAGEWAYRVTQVSMPDSVHAGVSSISFACPKGPNTATAHVHPNSSCLSETDCIPGSSYAHQCFASDQDYRFLEWKEEPFGLVVCDRYALVPFLRKSG